MANASAQITALLYLKTIISSGLFLLLRFSLTRESVLINIRENGGLKTLMMSVKQVGGLLFSREGI